MSKYSLDYELRKDETSFYWNYDDEVISIIKSGIEIGDYNSYFFVCFNTTIITFYRWVTTV